MFTYSIDNKKDIIDLEGNRLKDLTESIFSRTASVLRDYTRVRMTSTYHMRPDKVSVAQYGHQENAEFILKFSGVSNPFTLDDDDVLMIPNETQAIGMMAINNDEPVDDNNQNVEAQIRNIFKFKNTEYKHSSESYDRFAAKDIPSGVIDTSKDNNYTVPYISQDGRTAVILRNGRVYFGEDSGVQSATSKQSTTAGIQNSIRDAINQSLTALSNTNCLYNGMSLTDLNRATQKNN